MGALCNSSWGVDPGSILMGLEAPGAHLGKTGLHVWEHNLSQNYPRKKFGKPPVLNYSFMPLVCENLTFEGRNGMYVIGVILGLT